MPGIYFKYDMSALKVVVSEDREPLVQFLVRLCAVCGGIYVTSGEITSRPDLITGRAANDVLKTPECRPERQVRDA